MIVLPAALDSLLTAPVLHFTTLWKIERTDGEVLYLTDHDAEVVFDGDTYLPTTGASSSARQQSLGLSARNVDLMGIIDDDNITDADLRAGRYREAKVTEYLVDWIAPHAGAFLTNTYWITEARFSGFRWEARVGGQSVWLQRQVGKVFGRTCWHDLGDGICRVDLEALTVSGTVTAVSSQRRSFTSSDLAGSDTGYFGEGKITWTSGDNDGLTFDVKSNTTSTGLVVLQLKTPFDISAGDTFDIVPGCDRLLETCRDKFNNVPNWGGSPFIPGNDKMVRSPGASL